jgi:hypothetical protein
MITSVLIAMTVALAPVAEPRGAPEPAPTAAPAPVEAKRYCIVETFTGSLLPKRVCHSRAEWLQQGYDPLKSE